MKPCSERCRFIDLNGLLLIRLMMPAGVIAKRLLAERGLIYLEDLDPDTSREVLRAAWQQAARERFPQMDIEELVVEIDAMIDSLIMDVQLAGDLGAAVH